MSENHKKTDQFSLIQNEKQKNIQRTFVNFSFEQNNIGKPLSARQADSESGLTIDLLRNEFTGFFNPRKNINKADLSSVI